MVRERSPIYPGATGRTEARSPACASLGSHPDIPTVSRQVLRAFPRTCFCDSAVSEAASRHPFPKLLPYGHCSAQTQHSVFLVNV